MITARTIKKYPNRRLYDTEESRYITLTDIKSLVLSETGFVVIDKKSGSDITRSILLQVISDEEQTGEAVMSAGFLAQIIRCYGNVGPARMADHLENGLRRFMADSGILSSIEIPAPCTDPGKNSLTSGP